MSRPTVRSFAVSALAALLLISGLPRGTARPAVATHPPDPAVFINEIHYDNTGTDAGEFVEIAGPAGTDLTNAQIVLYNGNTPTAAITYDTDTSGGTIPNQQNGYGTASVSYPPNGIQNGSFDGLALVLNGALLQFLSYEGLITASNGPATGETSTDIGVSESGSGPLGDSLQLGGTGTTYQDFSWQTTLPHTQNLVNTGQTFSGGGGDTAPIVSSTTPADNATGVAADSNISITFSEPVDVAAGWYSISCTTSGSHEAVASGGPTTFTLNPNSDFSAGETCAVTIEADNVSDQDADDPPNNMAADYTFDFSTSGACGDAYTPIYTIQGSGTTSPLNGTSNVATEGVLTGDFQPTDGSGLSGFFIQEPSTDANTATSDGVFVFVPAASSFSGVALSAGDRVRVTGRVTEFNTLTEIDLVSQLLVCSTGNVLPTATVVDLPEATNGDLERYEGMLITIPETLTVSQNFFLGRYGQLHLSSDGRMYTPTNSKDAGSPQQQAQADLNARRQVILDDGRSGQNPNPIPYMVEGDPTTNEDDTVRAGDTAAGITGNLDFGPISSTPGIRDYRIHPTAPVEFTWTNLRTAQPEGTGGNVTAASFNVLNYFTTLDVAGAECIGPDPNPRANCRGADSQAEFDRQKAKIVAAITAMDADVVGLMELQNNGDGAGSALADLVAALNADEGAGTWAHIADPAFIGDDAIKVGLIYKPSSLTPVGSSVSDTDPIHDRPPVAQTFQVNATAGVFTAIVNHFKSKGSCPAVGDPDYAGNNDSGDGQGCWNARRVQQAEALLAFIDGLQTASGDDDVLVIGDLNAYGEEDPIQALEQDASDTLGDGAGGLIDQLDLHAVDEPYSYIFDGQSGSLDHALATKSMSTQVNDATDWHINADEPSVIDYNTEFKPDDRYTATPYRSSDHDPVLVGLQVGAPPPNQDPTADAQATPTTTEAGLEVQFDGTGSTDDDGTIVNYAWDFDGDGDIEKSGPAESQPTYRYWKLGTFEAELTVTDDDGGTDTDTVTITVIAPTYDFAWVAPTLDPPAQNRFDAGTVAEMHFTLGDDYGRSVLKALWPKHHRYTCGTHYNLLPNSQYRTRPFGRAGLTYDETTGVYTYHWQTKEEWRAPALSCRQFQIRLRLDEPPTVYHADVKFRPAPD